MRKGFILLFASLIAFYGFSSVPYEQATSAWKSHEDVANWLDKNFYFDTERAYEIQLRLQAQGPAGLLVRNPEKLYNNPSGYCADAANFAKYHLNRIDPNYNARWVLIKNEYGHPHHWVIAFNYKGRLYIMDYGAGDKWRDMKGTHGPYSSLDEYKAFLASLDIPGFKVEKVFYRDMPGKED